MKVLVAGATGAVGRQLVPRLLAEGHDVVAMTRSEARCETIAATGADPVVVDALDPDAVAAAVAQAEPEAIVHELTALAETPDMRHFDESFSLTNRLRTEATDHLLSAGRAAGVRRFVAQSFTGWPYARTGGPVKTEEDPLDPTPVAGMTRTLEAIRRLEDSVTGADWLDGVILRYGFLYGPHTSLSPDGEQIELIRRRKLPVIGNGAGVWSFVHVADAADATVLALQRGRGIYNIVDDHPAPVREWLPALAEAVRAKPPYRVPRLAARLLAGEAVVAMMTEVRGASNEKAKRELGWEPRHPSWRRSLGRAA